MNDIGPFYKFLGFCALIGGMVLALIHAIQRTPMGWVDAGIIFLLIMTCLALIRPDKFDSVVKSIADWLPFVKYRKPEGE